MYAGHAFTTMHITKTKNNNALLLAGYQSQLHSLHNYKQQQFYLTTLAIILAACYTNAQRHSRATNYPQPRVVAKQQLASATTQQR